MQLGKKLFDALAFINWAKDIGLTQVLIRFDSYLEVQLVERKFKCITKKYSDGYHTLVVL